MQRLHQLGQFKEEQGNLTADALYKKFQENLTVTHGEQLSKTYVALAIRVWEVILKCRQCRSMLMVGDEVFLWQAVAFQFPVQTRGIDASHEEQPARDERGRQALFRQCAQPQCQGSRHVTPSIDGAQHDWWKGVSRLTLSSLSTLTGFTTFGSSSQKP